VALTKQSPLYLSGSPVPTDFLTVPVTVNPSLYQGTFFFPTSLFFYPADRGNKFFWNTGNTAHITLCHHPKAESTSNFNLPRTQLSYSVGTVHYVVKLPRPEVYHPQV
jgi:hypothetical protein